MNIPVNEYQTPLTEELLDSLNDEVREQLLDFINNVEFIKNLISPDRKYARDLPRDEKGRIIVDLCNPHILEDMEYFRPTGNCFKEHGKVTLLKPNGNPKSEFGRWFGEEIRRCWEGYVRESDGEWVTGFEYFYLNYEPIIQIKQIGKKKQASRIVDFPKVWEGVHLVFHYLEQARHGGKYDNFEGGKHAVEIARRGASKSYIVAGILACIFLVGENRDACRETRGIVTAYDREKLIKDGTLNKFSSILDFCAEHTQFPYQRLQDSLDKMTWKLGYKDLNTNAEMGLKNVTLGVTAKDNVEKSRGKRSQFFGYEEFGAFKKFIDTWNVNLPSVQEGDIAFGLAFAIGTGGSEGNDFSGALEIIYNPMGYNVYALPNVFDKVNSAKQKTVFFFGAYLNLAGHYNEDGVSDVTGALIQILNNRHRIKYNSSDPMSLTRAKAENPITIQEAIMKRDSTMYPIADLTDRLNSLDADSHAYDDVYVGDLGMDNDYPFPKTGPDYESIRTFPHKNNKLVGAIEFYKMPERDSNGNIISGRYIAGIDPYDDDQSDTLSLGSIIVLDTFTDCIVCEYTGRPDFADDFYEKCRRILLFYNARANYENNKKGLFKYFSQTNSLYLLADNLDFLKERDDSIKSFNNKSKGSQSTEPVKRYGRRCTKDWLNKATIIPNEDPEKEDVAIKQLTKIKGRALILELIGWNSDGNFDRHDALCMCMLYREDILRLSGGDPEGSSSASDPSDKAHDDFFERNYKKAMERKSNLR